MPKSTTSANTAVKSSTANGTTTKDSEVDTSGLSQTLQGHVDDIRSLIHCGICIRPLYEPFTLACGHTFCYSCLTTWFVSARSDKTCPDCRSPVKAQPAPAYMVRAVVQLFISRAELLDKGETTGEHIKNQREEAEKLESDKKNDDPRQGGLFRGAFKPRLPIATPIVDLEDNVVRCPNCSWELEEDSCLQCGYRQDLDPANDTEGSDQWSDGDENSEMTDYFDDEVEDGFGELDGYDWRGGLASFPWPSLYTGRPETIGWRSNPRTIEDSEGEEEEEEEDYDEDMDSFIDDDEHVGQGGDESDPSTVVGGPDYSTQDHLSQMSSDAPIPQAVGIHMTDEGSEGIGNGEERVGEEETDDSDDEVGLDSEDGDGSEDGGDSEDGDEDSDDEDPVRPPVPGQRYHRVLGPTGTVMMRASPAPWTFDSRQSRAPYFGAGRENPRNQRSNRGTSTHNTIDISDDSDEGPVAPTRRTRGRINGPSF